MKQVEIVCSPCPFGLGVDPTQQICVAFRIEDDHDVSAPDVLDDQDLRKPCLAHARGAQHQRVADALADIHPDILFVGLHGVQRRFAADQRQRPQGIPPGAAT